MKIDQRIFEESQFALRLGQQQARFFEIALILNDLLQQFDRQRVVILGCVKASQAETSRGFVGGVFLIANPQEFNFGLVGFTGVQQTPAQLESPFCTVGLESHGLLKRQ
jgi:hypothetical protein